MRRLRLLLLPLLILAGGYFLLSSASWRGIVAPASPAARKTPFAARARILLDQEQQAESVSRGGFDSVPRSLLKIDRPMAYGNSVWNETDVPAGPVAIRIDLRTQILSIFRAGHEIGTAIILYGADAKETPLGRFPILWRGKDHRSSLYDAPMPFTLRLTGDGVSIHGSDVRWGAATHGCIGIPTDFAERLYAAVRVGDVVTILRSDPSASATTKSSQARR